jgi:hypothetical protein
MGRLDARRNQQRPLESVYTPYSASALHTSRIQVGEKIPSAFLW